MIAEVLKQDHDDDVRADSAENFALLNRNCARMMDQIKRVMEGHAKSSESDESFQPQCRTFELWPIVQAVKVDFRVVAEKAGALVVNQIPYQLTVWADAGLISTVIQNLLGNAFKHAPDGKIVVTASTAADFVTCSVQDHGKGIPAEMLPNVFDKHVTTSDEPGSGLGLAIVKQIVEAHSGTISVESTPGEGSTFTFTLPVTAA